MQKEKKKERKKRKEKIYNNIMTMTRNRDACTNKEGKGMYLNLGFIEQYRVSGRSIVLLLRMLRKEKTCAQS